MAVDDIDELEAVYWFDGGQQIPTVRRVVEHLYLIQDTDLSYPIILGVDCGVMDGHALGGACAKARKSRSSAEVQSSGVWSYRARLAGCWSVCAP
jgi:hypothetical protein